MWKKLNFDQPYYSTIHGGGLFNFNVHAVFQ